MALLDENDFLPKDAVTRLKAFNEELKETAKIADNVRSTKKAKEQTDQLIRAEKKLAETKTGVGKEIALVREKQLQANKTNKEAARQTLKLSGEYDKLSKELEDARKKFKNLAAAQKENTAEGRKQLAIIKRLDPQLKKIDRTTGQNWRTVGGYTQGIKAAAAQMVLWAAGITAFIRVFSNAFRRVRAFDKSIVELTGILGKSRKELKPIEKDILKVAAASTKTSSEVADLAVQLATLGKTDVEIQRLLEPVNNLSIALKATSDEAGQLLVGTLNAFQESSAEAIKYGDVIAKLRTSSAVDFQGITDALGFLAPTANAAGFSIEKTSAIIGVLVDNNIKAARAGRLTSTALLKLAGDGKTLEEGIDEITKAQERGVTETELLTIAGKNFGAQAAGIGIILANNVGTVDELTKSLQNAGGSLQELTDAQLESLDAKLKILDSSFERFILTITAGDNFIARDFKGSIQTLTGWFEKLADAISGTDRKFENWKDKIIESNPSTELLSFSLENLNKKMAEQEEILRKTAEAGDINIFKSLETVKAAEEQIVSIKNQIVFLTKLQSETKELAEVTEEITEVVEENTEAVEDNVKALKELDSLVAKLPEKLTPLQKGLLEITESLFGKSEIDEGAANLLSKVDSSIKKVAELDRKNKSDQLERDQVLAEQKQAILENSFELAGELTNRFVDLRIQQIGQELTAVEFQRDRELELAGDNERQKFEINKRFDEQRKQLQRKQAVTEKANAAFQIALNVAIGIVSAASNPLTIPLIPFIAAIGAVQLAAVIAAPIPQFDEGTESTPKDYIAGEGKKGGKYQPELRKSKGKWSLVDKPTLFKDSPGDKIVSGKETDSILGNITDLTRHNILTDKGSILSLLHNDIKIEKRKDSNIAYILERNNADLIRTIKNKKETNIWMKNVKVTEISSGRRVHILDYYYSR